MNRNIFFLTAMRIQVTLLLMLVMGMQAAYAQQDFAQVLLGMKERYQQMESVHIVMQVQVFEDAGASVPFYNEKVEIRKDAQRYRYRYADQDMLMNERYLIMVDRTAREIMCSKRNPKAENLDNFEPPGFNMDSLFSFYGKPRYMGKKDQAHHYQVALKDAIVNEVNLFIDAEANVFRKIDYKYRDGQHAVIAFQVFDVHPQFEPGTFDEQLYVTVSKTDIKPSKNFLNYQVVNIETDDETSN